MPKNSSPAWSLPTRKHELLNRRLREISIFTEELYFKYQAERRLHLLTVHQFRHELDEYFFGVPRLSTAGDFIAWSDEYIRIYERDPLCAYRTAQILKTALEHLIAFERHRGFALSVNDWDLNLFREFVGFLRTQTTAKADNTIHKIVSSGVKRFLIEAAAAGKTSDTRFASVTPKRLGVVKSAADDVYLTVGELKQLYLSPMPANTAAIRDCFICCAFLGLRISDWDKVDRNHIIQRDGRHLFEIAATEKPANALLSRPTLLCRKS
ncbi:MAG: phage integrase SAM-like domain-containing protein [Haliscomenobacter sp.]|nr:phage integrase SAM-like domain-containing protein [Haliscomenobacter sp.]